MQVPTISYFLLEGGINKSVVHMHNYMYVVSLILEECMVDNRVHMLPLFSLCQVKKVESVQELQNLVEDEMQFRFDCGYSKATRAITMTDKDTLSSKQYGCTLCTLCLFLSCSSSGKDFVRPFEWSCLYYTILTVCSCVLFPHPSLRSQLIFSWNPL